MEARPTRGAQRARRAVLAVAERSVEWLEDAADLPDTPIRWRDTGREPDDGV